jgi:RNA polymerase sigma factor (sigma-70 family)
MVLEQENFPDITEVAIQTGVPEKKVIEYLFTSYTEFNLADTYNIINEEDSITARLDEKDLKNDINKILAQFSKIEQYILINSFGLLDIPSMGILDIGKELNISSERVRQIKNKCIRILRHEFYASILKKYLD